MASNHLKKSRNILNHSTKWLSSQADSRVTKPFNSIPGPRDLPIIGNLWRYLPVIGNYKPETLYENALYNKKHYGSLVREKLTKHHTILHLFDPNDNEQCFRQDGKYPHRRSHRALLKLRLDRPEKYLDGGLFPENGPRWYKQRMQFNRHLLSKSNVAQMSYNKLDDMSLKIIEDIKSHLDANGVAKMNNFESILYKWALGNVVSVFLDIDIYAMDRELVDELILAIHESLSAIDGTELRSQKWVKKPDDCDHYKMLVKTQDILYNFVSDSVNVPARSNTKTSYLQKWLYEDKIDRRDIIAFIIDALMAGLHTTSYSVAQLLYQIAMNKSIQNTLRTEISEHFPVEGPICHEDMEKLVNLRDCLKESLRLNPVSIGTGRQSSSDDVKIRDYSIPEGVMIIAHTQTMSRDADIYDAPDEFRPERWKEYRKCPRNQRPSGFATQPFGFGARSCIGQRLAESQIKILAARLLQQFDDITFDDTISVKTTLIHNLDGPLKVTLTKAKFS